MEIDATFSLDMKDPDPVLLNPHPTPSPMFITTNKFQRKGTRKLSLKKKKPGESNPYALRNRASFKKSARPQKE